MASQRFEIGRRIAPPRFLLFIGLVVVGVPLATGRFGLAMGSMLAFDVAAAAFLLSAVPLLGDHPEDMRRSAERNDANRLGLLVITGIVSIAVLAAVSSVLLQEGQRNHAQITLIVATLALSWTFSTIVYALHYAHMFYVSEQGHDTGGVTFPETDQPDYWDFIYFATCLGMTFQVSDMSLTSGRMRRVVTFHCLAAFVFNLGIVAFTINVLGGG
jgi:uncharacterized membrane protein